MSRLAVVLQEKTKMTVLSSPRLGVDYLADRVAEIAGLNLAPDQEEPQHPVRTKT